MMKKIFFFAAVLLFFSGANAYVIDKHLIQANIAEDGTAKVTEKFSLVFRQSTELAEFRRIALQNGSSMEAWSVFDGNISTHIDSIKGGTGRVIFEDKQNEKLLILEYETLDQVMQKKNESSRKISWELNNDVFNSFESGSIYVIPGNVDISIVLPKNALLDTGTIAPSGFVSGNIVGWSGPMNISGKLVLDYSTEKQIATTIGISKALQDIANSKEMPFIAIAIILALALVYWKRKAVGKKIENYIVGHSNIETKQAKEEEELE